jgi:hypothetical protein
MKYILRGLHWKLWGWFMFIHIGPLKLLLANNGGHAIWGAYDLDHSDMGSWVGIWDVCLHFTMFCYFEHVEAMLWVSPPSEESYQMLRTRSFRIIINSESEQSRGCNQWKLKKKVMMTMNCFLYKVSNYFLLYLIKKDNLKYFK